MAGDETSGADGVSGQTTPDSDGTGVNLCPSTGRENESPDADTSAVPNVFLVGPMGVGKTTIGRQLASDLHLEFVDSDVEIEARTGADIPWIFDVEGESGFRKRETEVIDDLTQKTGVLIATGGGAVLADVNRERLASRGVVVYLETSVAMQMKRTKRDRKRPLLRNDLPATEQRKVLEGMKRERDPLYAEVAHLSVFVGDASGRKLVNLIKHRLVQGGWLAESWAPADEGAQ